MSKETNNVVVLVPILNFDCDEDLVKLDHTLSIRRTSPDEIKDMIKQFPNYPLLSAVGDAKYVIEKEGISTEIRKEYFSERTADAEKTTLAFRLLSIDKTWMPTAFYVSADSLYVSNPFTNRITVDDVCSILHREQIEEFQTIWNALNIADKKKPYLVFALSQFTRSFEDSTEEQFVDYITAFESIVFGRGTNAPSPYGRAIGIAVGMLIGKKEKERKSIEQRLNEAYEIRNKVVHGHLHHKLGDPDDEKLLKLATFTKDCLVKCLKKLLTE